MNSVIFMIFIFANDINARTIKINAQGICTKPLSNITNLSEDDYKHDTPDQLKYVALEEELRTENEERRTDSESNERSNERTAKLNPTKVTEDDTENEKRTADIDYDTNTSLQLNEASYKYAINTDDDSNENSTDFEQKDNNNRPLENQSDITNIRKIRSELLNHLLEYFMNIIKEDKHSETRKKYSKDGMKLEDKLKNYYHSDLDQLFYEDSSDLYENDTEHPNEKRKTDGEDATVDEEDEITNLDTTKNIQPFESKVTKIEENTPNKIIPDNIKEATGNDGLTDEEPVGAILAVEKEDNSTISDLINNKENNLLNIEETDTDLTTEQINQTQNTTGAINNIESNEKSDSSEIYKNKSQNSEEINSNIKYQTWMKQFFFGLYKNDNLDDAHKTSSGYCKNNYIVQLNILL